MLEGLVRTLVATELARFRDWVQAQQRQLAARLFLRTIITQASEGEGDRNVLMDAVEGHEPGNGERPASDDVERVEIAGYLIIPVTKDPSLRLGDNSPAYSVPLASTRWRPRGGKQGEVCVYNLSSKQATRWIRQNGRIEDTSSGNAKTVHDENGKIAVDSAAGQDVVVNGGTLPVARKTDKVSGTADMDVWMAAVNAAITALAAGDPVTLPPNVPAPIGYVDDGADRFKA